MRLTDVPRALAGRRYSSPADVVIEVRDEILPANAGRWRLTTAGEAAPARGLAATCEPATGEADLALDVTELGAAYLGGTPLATLAGAGLVTELRPGAVRAAFHRHVLGARSLVPDGLLGPAARRRELIRRGRPRGGASRLCTTQGEEECHADREAHAAAAMRAWDVSRPRAEHLAEAEAAAGTPLPGAGRAR